MSVAEWKAEAVELGMSNKETKEYVLKQQQRQEERERAQERAAEIEREREKAQEREAEYQREKEREAHALEMQKLAADREREREAHEIRLAQLQTNAGAAGNNNNNNGNGGPHMPAPQLKLAPFKVTDRIEVFIARFEEAAQVMRFDEATKRIQFMSLFEGQALEIIHRLDENARDYDNMKEALLSAYGKSVEELKKQFFSATLGDDETAVQFAARLRGYFEQWRRKDGAEDSIEGIKDLILRAQYVKSCPEELVARLKMDKVNTLEGMKEMAESYFEACGRKKKQVKANPSPSQPPVSQPNVQTSGVASRPWHSNRYNSNFSPRPRGGNYSPQHRNNQPWRQSPRGTFERKPLANAQAPPAAYGGNQGM